MRYTVKSRETNDIYSDFATLEEAEREIRDSEEYDKENGCFVEDSYCIGTNIDHYRYDNRTFTMKQIAEIICDHYETDDEDDGGCRYGDRWFSVYHILNLLSEEHRKH